MSEHAERTTRLPAEVLLVAIVVLLAGLMFKSHCYLDGGWHDGEQYTVGCYTDVVPFWTERGVADGAVPYLEAPLEYPVLTGAQIWLEGALSRMLVGPDGTALAFVAVVTLVNAALAMGILLLMHRMGLSRARLWWWVLAPALVLYVGHNWDLLAMFLTVLAVALHRADRPAASGAAIGLGAAAKLFPALLLPLLLLTHLRRRDIAGLVRTGGAAGLAWLAVNLPVALAASARWAEFYTFSQERLGTFAATWTVLNDLGLLATDVEQRNLWGSVAFAVGAALIVGTSWRRHRGHEWVLITPLLAWFLLTNKVWSPQFDLWLVPLIVLTARRLWPLAAFAVTDVLVYWTEFWWLARRAEYTPSGSYEALAAASTLRAAALMVIIVLAVWDRRPEWMGETAAAATDPAAARSVIGADSR